MKASVAQHIENIETLLFAVAAVVTVLVIIYVRAKRDTAVKDGVPLLIFLVVAAFLLFSAAGFTMPLFYYFSPF